MCYPGICLNELRKTTRNLSGYPGFVRYLNTKSLLYGVILAELQISVLFVVQCFTWK